MKKVYKRYSEAFKRQVISEYEAGVSVNALRKKYDIRGSETINLWIKKYARDGFRHEMIRIQTADEINQIKALENKIEELEQALGKVMLEKFKLESIVEELEESYGVATKKKKFNHPKALGQDPKTRVADKHERHLCSIRDYASGSLSEAAPRSCSKDRECDHSGNGTPGTSQPS